MLPFHNSGKEFIMAVGGNYIEQIGENSPGGQTFGGTTTSKISFYGIAPVVQAAAPTAVVTTTPSSTSAWGFSTSTQANAIITAVNALITALGSSTGVGLTA
jgi:hypothetical protein